MTNFEANRELIEKMLLETGGMPLSVQKSGKIGDCDSLPCYGCLFHLGNCCVNRKAWLNAEAESEEMKFARTLKEGDIVEVSDTGKQWYIRYFKQISDQKSFVCYGACYNDSVCSWKHIRKAEFRKGEQE